MKDLRADQIAAISRLFASGLIREMARKGRSPQFASLVRQSGLLERTRTQLVRGFFDEAFSLLKREGYRHEYIYKAAVIQKVLLGRHSLQTASMLNEFRVGGCIADIVILNGTATVYEIKSERDSLSRLERQVATYSDVFASVYVIAADIHLRAVLDCVPEHVGVLHLNQRHHISTLREARKQPERTSPMAIFDAVRTSEAETILELQGRAIPQVPNTKRHAALRDVFKSLDPLPTHECMVTALKQTRNLVPLSDLVAQLPKSLQPAALSIPLRRMDHARLVSAVHTKLEDSLAWA